MKVAQNDCVDDIEYYCTEVLSIGCTNNIRDIFSTAFMREYTYFVSFDTLLELIHASGASIRSVSDLIALDTLDADRCIASNSEFDSWHDFVLTACAYFLAENLK